MSDLTIDGVEMAFLELCRSHVESAKTEAGTQSPLSPSSILVSPTPLELDRPIGEVDQIRLTKNYPDAYTDTYGLFSGQPFIFKTGASWPKRQGPQPFLRELRPVNGHPILSCWDGILTDVGEYLKKFFPEFTAVMGLGFANRGEKTPFCPLVVTIGVVPETVGFEDAKTIANHVKINILTIAGFGNIEVAIWEFTTSFSGAGPKLPSLNSLADGSVTEFSHPFASTLGIAIAPLREISYEGSLGLFLTRGDGSEILALTAAHVARPLPMFPNNRGLTEKAASKHREGIVALGTGAYWLATHRIEVEIGNLYEGLASEEKKLQAVKDQLDRGVVNSNEKFADQIEITERNILNAKVAIKGLNHLHNHITKYTSNPSNRWIGDVLFADPIGVSSDGPKGYTRDWAVIKIRKDAFADDFQGNKMYIGDKLNEDTFLELMFPNVADRGGYAYPENGLLQLRGVVPEVEILNPKQLNANGDPAMAVVKNDRTTGTTVGWVSQLESLTRNYGRGINFTSRELTIVYYGGKVHDAFSDRGDSGSIITDRNGRIVGLLTAGGGVTRRTDVTFATPYFELEKRIKEAIPGVYLYN